MKKILIIAEKFSTNLGDALIYSLVKSIFQENYIIDSLDLSGRDGFSYSESSTYNTDINLIKKIYSRIKIDAKKIGFKLNGRVMKKTIKQFKNNFLEKMIEFKPDCIIFAGGQMFMDSFFSQILFVTNYCDNNDIPIIFNACGCSNKIYCYELKCIKKILKSKSVVYISLRDKYELIKHHDLKNIVFETYDTALLSSKYIKNNISNLEKKIGIGIMYSNFYDYDKQFNFWTKILLKLNEDNINFEIFCNGAIDDYNFILELCKKNGFDKKIIAKRPRKYEELLELICGYKCILSMRLHSLIIAYSYHIPAIAISWDSKVKEFYSKINNSSLCYNLDSNSDNILSDLLSLDINKFDYCMNEKINDSIQKNINTIRSIIEKNN